VGIREDWFDCDEFERQWRQALGGFKVPEGFKAPVTQLKS
jgi:hypothetical protein